jgi:hypothetical protein
MTEKPVEDWSGGDVDRLLAFAWRAFDESVDCRRANCGLAALVFLGSALEAVLLGMVVTHSDELNAAGLWEPQPSKLHLIELANRAHKVGWLPDDEIIEDIMLVNKARNMAAHPGAFVREAPEDPAFDLAAHEGYLVIFERVRAACEHIAHAVGVTP